MLYHFSLSSPTRIIGSLEGRKYKHKHLQRTGQKFVDEFFENIRKRFYQDLPSLFTSLWVTETYDRKIAIKKFIDNPNVDRGYLYDVDPLSMPVKVDGLSEVNACQYYAWKPSYVKHDEIAEKLTKLAKSFWENRHNSPQDYVQDYLVDKGANIVTYTTIERSTVLW